MVSWAVLFLLLFVGVPMLMHRYNWLTVKDLVPWE